MGWVLVILQFDYLPFCWNTQWLWVFRYLGWRSCWHLVVSIGEDWVPQCTPSCFVRYVNQGMWGRCNLFCSWYEHVGFHEHSSSVAQLRPICFGTPGASGTDSWPCKGFCVKSETWIEWGLQCTFNEKPPFIQCSLIFTDIESVFPIKCIFLGILIPDALMSWGMDREIYPPFATLPKQKHKHTIQCFILVQALQQCVWQMFHWQCYAFEQKSSTVPQNTKGFSTRVLLRHGVDWWSSAWSLPLLGAKCTALLWDCVARVPVAVPLFTLLEQWGVYWGLDKVRDQMGGIGHQCLYIWV